MKDNVRNIAASVKARLMSKAKETNRPFAEVLQYFGMERFLYRLSRSKYSEKFILKGALMFTVWQIPERRTTLDIDFLARYDNQIDSIENAMKDICEISIESDGIVFDLSTVKGTRIKADADYEGVRIKLIGFLEQSRIPLQIDIGFGDVVYPNPKTIDYPVVLDFPKPHLKGYPAENTISEKFEAMITLGSLNSRMKDFYDIWLLMRQHDFDGTNLAAAIQNTFTQRKIELPAKKPLFAEEIYDHGSDRQKLWKAFIVKEESKIAPEHLSSVAKEIEDFLILPVKAIAKTKEFNKHWKAPGPWK
ncbi:MAG: hypothetical protein A2452_00810 [Candidatus Firestonebacteria bacterium RIFOXYC2_FULL_39_67]|nr:MAG: hypothetical protein A2536_10770 [Candidatus Firestonebacteria bacterium RIFOXYD2_FULL_39_29]OGF53410.1 MAG: hypothetical protein A2497_03315 [Candidatus Firestonebacteria bacterium RifOxyC12_full_39_7]OGF54740.1 MAG: hypothetical protein A2452_00810 [Candidatus Firestonebacteria bacterium RIFOXYC2_FULL_39_67]